MVAFEIDHIEECRNSVYLPGGWPQQVIGLPVSNDLVLTSFQDSFRLYTAIRACSSIDLFFPVSNMVQMDGLEVIEVRAVLKSPPVRRLRLLVLWISEPSVFDGLEVSLFYCTCFVFRFPMIVLPLFWSMTFSWLHLLSWCMVDLIWCQFDSWSFLFVQARTWDMLHMSIRLFLLWNITTTMGIELFWMFRLVCTKQCCPFLWLDASMLRWKTFLFQIVHDGIGAISILQLVKLMSDIFVIRSSSL